MPTVHRKGIAATPAASTTPASPSSPAVPTPPTASVPLARRPTSPRALPRETLLEIAARRGLGADSRAGTSFEGVDNPRASKGTARRVAHTDERMVEETYAKAEHEGDPSEAQASRLAETVLWCVSLAMLHGTLDVLVQHQYAQEIAWGDVLWRSGRALVVFTLLFYTLHPHPEPPYIVSNILPSLQPILHQSLFLSSSIAAGCYLIHITNRHAYYAVMKQAPGLGCLWIWSVIELDLWWAVFSTAICVAFLWFGGYAFL